MAQQEAALKTLTTRCCIAGGGPAGMMLGLLLARAGVEVVVLEKHADFLRDFRGDTIHPSTLEVMHELGLLEDFLKRPHDQVTQLDAQIGTEQLSVADFSHLPTHCKFLALMPQWDFLNFIAEHARAFPAFQLQMQAEVTDLLRDSERIVGVQAQTPLGALEVHADLVIGADGRRSTVRSKAGLAVQNIGAPIDVLWFRLSRRADDPAQTFGRVDIGHFMIMLNRGDYWQCAYVIPKGGYDAVRARGLPQFRDTLAALQPYLRSRMEELAAWDDVKLLTVAVDRLRQWYRPGLLCIGDAAHAMSPIGGVGINLAIQDAVASANLLAPVLRRGAPALRDLAAVQRRRMLPTRMTQRLQVLVQNRVISRVLASGKPLRLPWPLKLLRAWPWLRRLPARIVGLGFRPEHVRATPVPKSTVRD
jgi:2-polyprenyl-6-methoxyphenol hydroxylase-like FAD-dependent oxidoreductase